MNFVEVQVNGNIAQFGRVPSLERWRSLVQIQLFPCTDFNRGVAQFDRALFLQE